MFIGKVAQDQGKNGTWGRKGCIVGCGERELTIGHTRGEVLSLVVSAPAHITGALSGGLRRLALQHVDDVHAVDALQSRVQALHCSKDVRGRDTGGQEKETEGYRWRKRRGKRKKGHEK